MKNFALNYFRTDFKGERQGRLLSGSKSTKQITLRRGVRRESEILAASKSDYLSKSSWELSKYIFLGPFLGDSNSANEIPSLMSVLKFWPYSHMTLAVLHFFYIFFLFSQLVCKHCERTMCLKLLYPPKHLARKIRDIP